MSDGGIVVDENEGAVETPAGISAHDQAMIEKGRSGLSDAPPVTPQAPQVPAGIPDKFVKDGVVDYGALAASYSELEKRLSAPAAVTPAAAEEEPAQAADASGKIAKPTAPSEGDNPLTGLLDAARADFTSTQAFSEETAAKLVEAGIPAEVQAVYLAGLQALTTQNVGAIHGYVGGEAQYQAMSSWAAEKLSDAELDAFNDALDNPQLRENAVRGLFARYQSARPGEGKQITPAAIGAAAGDVFKTRDDLVAAQKDPRYATDASYRNEVFEKLKRSQAVGFQMQKPRTFEAVYSR